MFSGATHNTFTNTTFVIQSDRNAAFDKLQKAASPSAFHSFVGRPQPGICYPNTRVNLLEGLEKWTTGMELPDNLFYAGLDGYWDTDRAAHLRNLPIMWLRGGAGAGKSAVAQTFAERCEDLGHIVASFFFFSTDPTRNNANSLVATLAYQIALADPQTRSHIESVIHHDPRIFDKDFKRQFTSLIIDPIEKSLRMFDGEERHRPCTVIIDGLDECTGSEAQAGIVRAISDTLRAHTPTTQSNLPRFLVCSRPEEPIARVFRSPNLTGIHVSIDLSRDKAADHDIKVFLEGKFAEIKRTHPHADQIPDMWPSWHDLETLQQNSSGHFIYADTVIKFISAYVRPVIALESILGLRASPQRAREPFAELDVLYHHILSRALEKVDISTICHAFGILKMKDSPAELFRPKDLEKFLNLQDGELDALFGTMVSLVSVSYSTVLTDIRFRHKSFRDFLYDQSRAGRFYIDDNTVYMYAAARCQTMIVSPATLDESKSMIINYNLFDIH